MIYTYIGERASRTHENQMLSVFLESLEDRWLQSADWIFVVANAMWDGAEVDLVCILPTAIVVADFKNYRGHLMGTENGPWLADGITVKGGAKINPFVQLRDNRIAVRNWISRKDILPERNLGHLAAAVVFSGPITESLDISPRVKSWFQVTDFKRCTLLLDSIASPELAIRKDEATDIVRKLGVVELTWTSSRPGLLPIPGANERPQDPRPLTEHQADALRTINEFLTISDFVSMAVRGMTSTGKTRLLADAIESVVRLGRKAIPLTPNLRLALQANQSLDIECDSIYRHIYDFSKIESNETNKDARSVKTIPSKICEDPDDCVYLVDDAHLLGNAEFNTPDGKRFGTGRLLTDFFEFAKIGQSGRQVVFFGDPYQIQRASPLDSILDGSFQMLRNAKHRNIELDQVVNMNESKGSLRNALRLVEAMRTEQFASLELIEEDGFHIINRQQAATELLEHFLASPVDTWYLADTHGKVNGFTDWLRPQLLRRSELGPLEAGDLLEIYVAPHLQDPGLSELSSNIKAGQRLQVEEIGKVETYIQGLSGRKEEIKFQSINCKLSGEGWGTVEILEDFLVAEKPELAVDTLIAMGVWQKKKSSPEKENHSGFVLGRYGYGSTVHHAQGMKQSVCFVNAEHSAGRHTDGYFRWLYTAMTIAQRSLVLFNFEPIHPLDTATWNLGFLHTDKEVQVGAGWQFYPDAQISAYDQERKVPEGLSASKNLKNTVAIWLRVGSAAEGMGWKVCKVSSHPFQERLDLMSPNGDVATIRAAYNGNNVVTALHMSNNEHWPLLAEIAANCIGDSTYTKATQTLISIVRTRVAADGWRIVSATESSYRLTLGVVRAINERVSLEMNFDKQGLVSSIRPLQCSCSSIVEEIRSLLQ